MQDVGNSDGPGWTPSVYHAEIVVHSSLADAWPKLLDYEAWNPTFTHATVTSVSGKPGSEGEIVVIKKTLTDVTGAPLPEFYSETAKLVPNRQVVWYVYPKGGQSFCNFVDFKLTEVPSGVRFDINYYAQDRLSRDLLLKQRAAYQELFVEITVAFKKYCEARL